MRGQVALEFVMFSTIFLIFMIAVLVLVQVYGGQEIRTTSYLLAVELANRVSQAVATTAGMGEGFSYKIALPPTLGDNPYNITLINATAQSSSRVFIELPFDNGASNVLFANIDCANKKTDAKGRTMCKLEAGETYEMSVREEHVFFEKVS